MKVFYFWLALKMLVSHKKIILVSWGGLISIIGISVGFIAILISLSVLNGFENNVRNKIINFESDIRLINKNKYDKNELLINNLNKLEDIQSYSFFIEKKAIAISNDKKSLFKIKAINIEKIDSVYNFLNNVNLNQKSNHEFILGSGVANRLGVILGDEIKLMNPFENQLYLSMPKIITGRVTKIFETKILDFDQTFIFIPIFDGKRLFNQNNFFDGVDIRLKSNKNKSLFKEKINIMFNKNFEIKVWEDIHKVLFQAMKMEKLVSILILSLVVIVACFNITSTLTMQTLEKIREIGILKTIGFSNNAIRDIFFIQGFLIGGIGLLIGAILGFIIIYIQSEYGIIKLPGSIYFVDSLPMKISIYDYLTISFLGILFIIISIYFPINELKKINPHDAISYEK